MSSQEEMRRVMLHAAEKLDKAKDGKVICTGSHGTGKELLFTREAYVAMSYAEGVLKLLASYLMVEDAPSANGKPHATQPGEMPVEKVERNRAIVAAREAGEARKDVAERFHISERRVDQIVEAHRRKAAT